MFDRYGVDSFGYVGNPNLKPESSRGYELGVTTELPVYGRADGITLSGTYFDNRIKDLIQSSEAAMVTQAAYDGGLVVTRSHGPALLEP